MTDEATSVLEDLLTLTRTALDPYFGQSDPTAYAALFAGDATYFDPNSAGKLDGDAIEQHFAAAKGQIPPFTYEFLNPAVDLIDGIAVFTFNLDTYDPTDGAVTSRWNATQVHRRTNDGWAMVHAHWSLYGLES